MGRQRTNVYSVSCTHNTRKLSGSVDGPALLVVEALTRVDPIVSVPRTVIVAVATVTL